MLFAVVLEILCSINRTEQSEVFKASICRDNSLCRYFKMFSKRLSMNSPGLTRPPGPEVGNPLLPDLHSCQMTVPDKSEDVCNDMDCFRQSGDNLLYEDRFTTNNLGVLNIYVC